MRLARWIATLPSTPTVLTGAGPVTAGETVNLTDEQFEVAKLLKLAESAEPEAGTPKAKKKEG
jgi:hypothetical protein